MHRREPTWKTRIVFAVVGLAFAAGIAAYSAHRGWLRWRDPSAAEYPVGGIDVSHHQKAIDWPAVHDSGVVFAFIKATEGGDFRDPRFRDNWEQAARAGVRRGAYHFFTFCTPAGPQADNFLSVVPADSDMLPAAIDIEFVGNCAQPPSDDSVRGQLRSSSHEGIA